MAKRTFSAFIAIALLFVLIWADSFTGWPLIEGALYLINIAALFEIFKALGFFKKFSLLLAGETFGMLIFQSSEFPAGAFPTVCMLAVMTIFVIAVLKHKTVNFSDICALFFAAFYVSCGMLHIKLLYKGEFGLAMIFVALIAAFLTDTGAYFTGYFLGKHKLIPEVSPKKTVEGAIGGVVVAILSMLVYAWILTFFGIKTNLLNIVIIGGVASVMSQFGDLSASLIKRSLGIKDYGDIMPGHGGVMDRIDSLLFTAPVVYFLNMILPIMSK